MADIRDLLNTGPHTRVWRKRESKFNNLSWSLKFAKLPGQILEFGVGQGYSINHIADQRPGDTIYGFDTFLGLETHWHDAPAGSYSNGGVPPAAPKNVKFVQGRFQDTLPNFSKSTVSYLHIDCDYYESTAYVLDSLAEYIVTGTVITFDEFHYSNFDEKQEYHAFMEFIEKYDKNYTVISMVRPTRQVSVLML